MEELWLSRGDCELDFSVLDEGGLLLPPSSESESLELGSESLGGFRDRGSFGWDSRGLTKGMFVGVTLYAFSRSLVMGSCCWKCQRLVSFEYTHLPNIAGGIGGTDADASVYQSWSMVTP